MRRQPYQRPEESKPTWEDLDKSGSGGRTMRLRGHWCEAVKKFGIILRTEASFVRVLSQTVTG